MFIQFRRLVQEAGLVDDEALFTDGTKILANANKYSFVWKKSIDRYNTDFTPKIDALYETLIQNEIDLSIERESDRATDVIQMTLIAKQVEQEIQTLDNEIEQEAVPVGGSSKKQRRRHLKKLHRKLTTDFISRRQNYDEALATFGDCNNFSKTDPDATFMRMKEDPMRNVQLKPGYNLQIVTNHQYTLYFDLTQRPTDTRTFVPFLKKIDFEATPVRNVVADAGYGSEQNYAFITDELEKGHLIPYGMYEKEQTRRYQNDTSKVQNWQYI